MARGFEALVCLCVRRLGQLQPACISLPAPFKQPGPMARLSVHDGRNQPHGGGDELADWCQAVDGPNSSRVEGCRGSYHILVRGAWGKIEKALRPIFFLGTKSCQMSWWQRTRGELPDICRYPATISKYLGLTAKAKLFGHKRPRGVWTQRSSKM